MSDLQQQIDELRARLTTLERERWTGPPRLGPRPQAVNDVQAQTQQIAEAVTRAQHEHETDRLGRQICTTSGDAPSKVRAEQTNETGQHGSYLVLCEEERQKGFVRPLRRSYKHVGPAGPTHPMRDLTEEEHERYDRYGYVKFEMYPVSEFPATGQFWTQVELDNVGKGCGTVTTMGLALCETYARDPTFYGSTFCAGCNKHLPVGEFTWKEDGQRVGS